MKKFLNNMTFIHIFVGSNNKSIISGNYLSLAFHDFKIHTSFMPQHAYGFNIFLNTKIVLNELNIPNDIFMIGMISISS